MDEWQAAQQWEKSWWGNCANTFNEELKQQTYARFMGLKFIPQENDYYIDLAGKSIVDIGGGPVSLLLRTVNGGELLVVDPCSYPDWVMDRYHSAGIVYLKLAAEHIAEFTIKYDEVWLYNCLQHTIDPEKIINKIKEVGKTLRMFEWLETAKNPGHPHTLSEEKLNKWIGQNGETIQLAGENNCMGNAYYGVFTL